MKNMAGDTWTLDVEARTSVKYVKLQLSTRLNVPQHLLELMTEDRVLQNDDVVEPYHSQVLNVLVRMPTLGDLMLSIPFQEDRAASAQIRFVIDHLAEIEITKFLVLRLERAGVTWEMFCQWLTRSKIEKLLVSDSELLVKLPILPFLTHLDLSKMDNLYQFKDSAFAYASTLTSLSAFTMNNTFMTDIDSLVQVIPSPLTHLSLSSNVMTKVPSRLEQLVSLKFLDLHGNMFDAEGANQLANAFQHMKLLTHLNLMANSTFGPSGIVTIIRALSHLSKLEYLDLSIIRIGSGFSEGISELVKVLPMMSSLTMLYMVKTGLDDIDAVALAKVLPSTLTELKLFNNRIGHEGNDAIAHEMKLKQVHPLHWKADE